MIKVSLDESACFDILSILLIKTKKSQDLQHTKNYLNFVADIKDEIGLEKLYEVMNSQEFEELREANLEVFHGVDLAKDDNIKASTLDALNYQRFVCKRKIQEKFFGEELREQKIGY
jgi:hypothetical protein